MEIIGNEIFANKDGLGFDLYVNYDSRNETTGVNSNYMQIDLNLANDGYILYPYIDYGCSFPASSTGGSSSTGMCDHIWVENIETKGEREVNTIGDLTESYLSGLWCVVGHSGLGSSG